MTTETSDHTPQRVIREALEAVQRRNAHRFADAVEAAQDAFWGTLARAFPEVTTGDFDPLADAEFTRATQRSAALWLESNYPGERD